MISRLTARVVRRAYARERIPAPLRWSLTAAGMRDWFQIVAKNLRPHLEGDTRELVGALGHEMFRRRYDALRERCPYLPGADESPRALPLLMTGLYQLPLAPRRRWITEAAGGGPRGAREYVEMLGLLRPLSHEQRWRELTVHLGEFLIVLTERLPERLPRARQIVARICFDMGVAYARQLQRSLRLSADVPVANAIEVLRTSEYLFRVNPEHTSEADESSRTGFIDGDACPWYPRPGWGPVHCGIFGQFQAGVCSVFELRYSLTKTIPKHGGDRCRVDLKPIQIRRPPGRPAA